MVRSRSLLAPTRNASPGMHSVWAWMAVIALLAVGWSLRPAWPEQQMKTSPRIGQLLG